MINLPVETKSLPTVYQNMLEKISEKLPALLSDQKSFFKSQSQFMDNMLSVTAPTPIRNLRQISAEINKTKSALDEAFFKTEKKKIKILKKQRDLDSETDDLEKKILEIDIKQMNNQITQTHDYMKAAIRKISGYLEQYNSILKKIGKDHITEEDFEREESKYHIAKAFEQALIAARSRNGIIDEGNHIYFHQIGINGAMAQLEVFAYLEKEGKQIENGQNPDHSMTLEWLEYLIEKYHDCPENYATKKGMTLIDNNSLLKETE
jgi:paraquat-inducible protein B